MQTQTKLTAQFIAAQIRPGFDGGLRQLFAEHGSCEPRLTWDPDEKELPHPFLVRFHELCQDSAGPEGRLLARTFNLDTFNGLHDWMIIVHVEDSGRRFRYGHYGRGISDIRGVSLQGNTTSALSGHIGIFFDAIYKAVIAHKLPILTHHQAVKTIFARSWDRLIVPICDDDDNVVQFAVLNVANNELSAGLEIVPDPILIADRDQIVRYANRAAREMFGRQIYLGSNMDLFTFAGIDMEMPSTPEELAQSQTVRDATSLVLRDTMIERFYLTISGTTQWGNSFYVITLRPEIGRPNAQEPLDRSQ